MIPRPRPLQTLRDRLDDERALGNLARAGGWIQTAGAPLGQAGSERHHALARAGNLVRGMALGYGTTVRLLGYLRPDLVTPDVRKGWHGEGFDLGWIARTHWRSYVERAAIWLQTGWEPRVWGHHPSGFQEALAALDRLSVPVAYCGFLEAEKTVEARSYALDLRIPACRDWIVAEVRRWRERHGWDGLQLDVRTQLWLHHPELGRQTLRNLPDDHPNDPGPIVDTFYGPGEFEAAVSDLVRRLAGEHLRCVATVRGRGWPPGDLTWLEPDARDLLEGQTVAPALKVHA